MGNQASDSKVDGGSYQIGDLDLTGSAKHPPSGPMNTAQEPPKPAPAVPAQRPANTQTAQAGAKANKVAGGGQMAAFGEIEESAAGPELELDLGPVHAPKKPAAAAGPAAKAPAAAAKASAASSALAYGTASLEDDEDAGAAILEVEQIEKKPDAVKSPARDAKQEAQKEVNLVYELAAYGDIPGGLLGAAHYAIHVARRLRILKKERQKAAKDCVGLEADLHTAFVEMGQALMEMRTEPQVAALRTQIAQVIDAQSKVSAADVTMSRTKAENQKADASLAQEITELARQLEPFVAAEKAALEAHKQAEEEVKRARGQVKRAEIELRSLAEASSVQDPVRAEDLRRELEERKSRVAQLAQVTERTNATLAQARRELALKKGALDAAEDKRKKVQGQAQKLEAEAEQKAKAAEGACSASLRTLAETAITQDLAKKLVPDRLAWVREVSVAVADANKVLARHDQALVLFDRPTVIKGWVMIGCAAAIVLLGLITLVS